MSATTPVLEMRGVRKSFPSPQGPVDVLRGIDLEVSPGEFVVVTGPSGSGKSTFLNLAGLLDHPTGGSVRFGGQEVSSLDEDELSHVRARRIGVVFQRFCLLPRRSALENVLFRFRYVDEEDEAEARSHATAALETVGLASAANRPARLLSAGEMQRVAVARAVALKPDLLVADEPTGNLDRQATTGVMECFKRLNDEGITVLMVTHNESLLSYAGRSLTCRDGVIR